MKSITLLVAIAFTFTGMSLAGKILGTNKSDGFAADFYNKIAKEKINENVVISPLSVQTCVAMTFFGASGETATEMVSGLHLTSSDKEKVASKFEKLLNSAKQSSKVSIANKLYASKNFEIKPEFNEIAGKAFHSEAENVDFNKQAEAVKTINDWVETKTNNKIQNLISPNDVTSDTAMILVNAIHFKAQWVHPFSSLSTHKSDFWLNDNDKVSVDTMSNSDDYKYDESDNLNAQILEMPYKDSDFSMMIILPKTKTGLKDLVQKIESEDFISLSNSLKVHDVDVLLPKFKSEFSLPLNDALKSMGMQKMFTNSAEFGGIFKSDVPVKVSDVFHKAFIEVNEDGTEAAAATFMKIVPMSLNLDQKRFVVNHPFVYLIKDKTSVYFIGHVAKI